MEPIGNKSKERRQGTGGGSAPLYRTLIKYLAYFAAFVVLEYAEAGAFSPFAAGLLFGLVWAGESAAGLMPLYIIAAFLRLGTGRPLLLVGECVTAVTFAAAAIAIKRARMRFEAVAFPLAAVAARSVYAVMAVRAGESGLLVAIGILLELAYAYTVKNWAGLIVVDGLKRKPHDVETICMVVSLFAVAAGFAGLEVAGVRLLLVFGAFVVPLVACFSGKAAAVTAAVAIGAGGAAHGDVGDVALLSFAALVYAMFSDAPRALSLVGMLFAVALEELWLTAGRGSLPLDLIAFFAGGLAFALIPRKLLRSVKAAYFSPPSHLALRALVGETRAEVADELGRVAAALSETERTLRRGLRPPGAGAEDFYAKLYSAVCAGCDGCDGRREAANAALMQLAESAERGRRAAVTDVPFFIENDCPHAARLFSVAGECAEAASRRSGERLRDDRARDELIAGLGGVRAILAATADKISRPPTFDDKKEEFLVEELTLRGVSVADALVVGDEATLVVRSDPAAAESAAASALGERVKGTVEPSLVSGYSVLRLKRPPAYDAIFASANISKNREATGDTHSFMRIGDGKFMLALCDGMGSGSEANRISETAIGLVESFYRAGFSDELTLGTVNGFLSRESDESFAAFDILVCDLFTLERTMIKLGSPASYVKSARGVVRLEGSALPLGAVGELDPSVTKDKAADGDVVFFVSDGVSDLYEGDSLAHFISALDTTNVRAACEAIVGEAKKRSGGEIRDDMTVVAAKIFGRV